MACKNEKDVCLGKEAGIKLNVQSSTCASLLSAAYWKDRCTGDALHFNILLAFVIYIAVDM